MKKLITFFIFCFFVSTTYAYNSNGHKVIAAIAYDNLTPEVKAKVTILIGVVGQYYAINQFIDGAPWADWLKGNNVTAYNSWHYIDQPIVIKPCLRCQIAQPQNENVAWAILQAQQVLTTPNSASYPQESNFEKSQFLLFFEHFVADIHQPLHTVSRFSTRYPTGDEGGNLYPINSPIANNLHAFWDAGGGIFPSKNLSDSQIKLLAANLEKIYPESSFAQQAHDLNPTDWEEEGAQIATNVVYTIPANSKPSKDYTRTTRMESGKRAALAGYRMANLLNQYFENE